MIMRKYLLLLCICLLATLDAMAQLPHDFRSEQIFLGVSSTEWQLNDSIDVQGVVVCPVTKGMEPYSRYLYIELISNSDSVMVRQKIACSDDGNFHAMIPTDAVLSGGIYYLRAYTNLMRNFSEESFTLQPLLIGKSFPKRGNDIRHNLKCEIYPDGGFVAENHIQGITVYLSENRGNAIVNAEVALMSNDGDTICTGSTSSSGLINFKYIPQTGKRYTVVTNYHSGRYVADVPEAVSDRMKLQCVAMGNRLKFEILNANKDLKNYRLHIYNKENGLISIDNIKTSGIIALDRKAMLTTAFLTDATGAIISEATAITKYDMQAMPSIPDTLSAMDFASLSKEISDGKRIRLRLTDDDQWMTFAESELLYLSDYRSTLPFPENFFKEDASERATDLQAWISTATFKRFAIADAITKDSAIYVNMPETAMTITGTVIGMDRHPCKGGTIVAYNTENNCVYDNEIGNDGRFRMAVDDFDEGTTFFLQTMDKREKPIESQIEIDDETYPAVTKHPQYTLALPEFAESEIDVNGIMTGITLADVVVKARIHRDEPISREKFYGLAYMDRTRIEQRNCLTLLDIIKAIPTVKVMYTGKDENPWLIYTTRGTSTLNGKVSLPLLIDGTRISNEQNDITLNMLAEEVEEVEVLRPWQALAYTWGAIDGAIKVITRGPTKKSKIKSKGTYYTPTGLSTLKSTKEEKITSGKHRLLIDIISQEGVTSYERDVVITE